jgi:hypothetical protein
MQINSQIRWPVSVASKVETNATPRAFARIQQEARVSESAWSLELEAAAAAAVAAAWSNDLRP